MHHAIAFITALLLALPVSVCQAETLQPVPAVAVSYATAATILDATWAGNRLVAVGDHGEVLLSDDQGKNYRQAHSVPLSTPLTGASFVNARQGWAVGHWGAILVTTDGGESWQIQRMATDVDRPLFAVHFFNAQQGVAVGLWSLVLTTDDGGITWSEQKLAPPPGSKRADLNLMGLFSGGLDTLYATAEHGQLLSSADRGKTWRYIDTDYSGTLWSGAVLADGRLLVGGQRGTLMYGSALGQNWQRVPLESKGSVTAIVASGEQVMAVGLDGLVVHSTDGGHSFQEQRVAEGAPLTTVALTSDGGVALFSQRGLVTAP